MQKRRGKGNGETEEEEKTRGNILIHERVAQKARMGNKEKEKRWTEEKENSKAAKEV